MRPLRLTRNRDKFRTGKHRLLIDPDTNFQTPDSSKKEPSPSDAEARQQAEPRSEKTEPVDASAEPGQDESGAETAPPPDKLQICTDKLKRALADYDNLQKKMASDIQREVNNKMDLCFLDFLNIYDDFIRAIKAYQTAGSDTAGLDSILKNMDSFLVKYNISAISAEGRPFDPNMHEAVSIVPNPDLEDGTITAEIRKGYISHNRIIRPTLVEISKKAGNEK